jgi:hypothetical protein
MKLVADALAQLPRVARELMWRSLLAAPVTLSLVLTLVLGPATIYSAHGWPLTTMPQTLYLVVGGIACKPAVVDGRIEPREILNLAVAFDHDVVDGAPAARFLRRLLELIESGYGLAENQPPLHSDNGSAAAQLAPLLA